MMKRKVARWFRETLTLISPKLNTEVCYLIKFHKRLNLRNPKTLNEKNLWLKLRDYQTNELVRTCADKYKVRAYIEKQGCPEILNDLIAVYDNPDAIDWNNLPKQFAMKLNVGCGANLICTDKNCLDIEKATIEIHKWFKKRFYLGYSEMQYKDVKPYLIVEKYLNDGTGRLPVDYKFYCFNGRAEYVMLCYGREKGHPVFYFYDRNWNFHPFFEKENPKFDKPDMIDEAFAYADRLANPFPYVRTDLYIIGRQIIFGELTFTSCGGMDFDISEEGLLIMGEKVDLNYVPIGKVE